VDPLRKEELTYSELGARADSITALLRTHGIEAGDRVGICAPKSCSVVAAIHGILAAGAAYVPVDAHSPHSRVAGILLDCSVAFVITTADHADRLRNAMDCPLDELARLPGGLVLLRGVPVATANRDVPPPGIAYVLYTSGSTGKPKGVVHTHASAMSFIEWCSVTFAPGHDDRFSSHAPFHFDLSILDLYLPAAHGASVVLIGEEAGKQPQALAALIAESRITVWYSTPSILRLVSEHGRLERHDTSALRAVLFAGEVFPARHLRRLREQWTRPRYFNLYGPTETNVCTWYEVPRGFPADDEVQLPIGFTCPNDRARVVDAGGTDVAYGEEGELVISGGTVMTGYWGLPERDATAFLVDATGARWYRTGDLVTESSDEGFHFHGRRDRMVKRRGYRVELGEIEAALSSHPGIAEAAVAAGRDPEGGVRIDAFLTPQASTRLSVIELKQFCARVLPAYMVPDRFVIGDSLPRTSTGKIDYTNLAAAT
jgi:amino acid adenylation domain-containing protein